MQGPTDIQADIDAIDQAGISTEEQVTELDKKIKRIAQLEAQLAQSQTEKLAAEGRARRDNLAYEQRVVMLAAQTKETKVAEEERAKAVVLVEQLRIIVGKQQAQLAELSELRALLAQAQPFFDEQVRLATRQAGETKVRITP